MNEDVGEPPDVPTRAYGGTMDATLPITANLTLPDEIVPGVPFTASGTWQLSAGAGFSAKTPAYEAGVGARVVDTHYVLGIDISGAKVPLVGVTGSTGTLYYKYTKTLPTTLTGVRFSDVYPSGVVIKDSPLMELFTGQTGSTEFIDRPNLLMSAGVTLKTLHLNQPLSALLQEAAPEVPLSGSNSVTVLPSRRAQVDYTTVTGTIDIDSTFEQAYYMEVEDVTARVLLEDGSVVEFALAATTQLTLPPSADANNDGRVDASVTYVVQARFSNCLRNITTGQTQASFARSSWKLYSTDTGNMETLTSSGVIGPLATATIEVGGIKTNSTRSLVPGLSTATFPMAVDLAAGIQAESCSNTQDDDDDGNVDCADAECDGAVCNATGRCQAGVCALACGDCDDGVLCTADVCDSATGQCQHVAVDASCPDNGFFCDGMETCHEQAGCLHTGAPCAPGEMCDAPTASCVALSGVTAAPGLIASIGDGYTTAFAAPCEDGSVSGFSSCMLNGVVSGQSLGGDYPWLSWSTGDEPDVFSLAQPLAEALGLSSPPMGATVAMTGARWRDFADAARRVCELAPKPAVVTVLLGAADVCDAATLTQAPAPTVVISELSEGLDLLTRCLPAGSTIRWFSMPRVDLVYDVGQEKVRAPCADEQDVSCLDAWAELGVCPLVTQGADPSVRAALGSKIDALNQGLSDEVTRYQTQAGGRNPNGVALTTDWTGSIGAGRADTSVGTWRPGVCDLNPVDCFHPSTAGQNRLACLAFAQDPKNPTPGAEDCGASRRCGNGMLESALGEQCETDANCALGTVCDALCTCVAP